jgi:starch synthase
MLKTLFFALKNVSLHDILDKRFRHYMESTKVLFVTQEITPYVAESEISLKGRYLPQAIQEKGSEIRTFMPQFGCINERRNQLHEVIRLSGMNLIIDDTDHPLIIKVASIQSARMQVYFIDNEDFFQRKFKLTDENGTYFDDNDERAIFFARGVLETVKKLRWNPDIIHCQGWFTGILPFYLKTIFKEDPLFMNSKVIYSVYEEQFNNTFSEKFKKNIWVDGMDEKSIQDLGAIDHIKFNKFAIDYSDGIIFGSKKIDDNIRKYALQQEKPILEFCNENEYVDAYAEFYEQLLTEQVNV